MLGMVNCKPHGHRANFKYFSISSYSLRCDLPHRQHMINEIDLPLGADLKPPISLFLCISLRLHDGALALRMNIYGESGHPCLIPFWGMIARDEQLLSITRTDKVHIRCMIQLIHLAEKPIRFMMF